MKLDLYVALRRAGVEQTLAQEAAEAVIYTRPNLATKSDVTLTTAVLKAELDEFARWFKRWTLGTGLAFTLLCSAIAYLLR
jgi:hypothetical protein